MLALGKTKPETKSEPNNYDSEFNQETSGGVCEESHIGSISRSKVLQGAAQKVKEINNPDKIPEQLLSLLIGISWCGERMGRWPSAKDSKFALSLRKDFDKAVDSYGVRRVYQAIQVVSKFLGYWDSRIVSEQVEKLEEEYSEVKVVSFSSSPLFQEFSKSHPHISPETFDRCYTQNNEEFVKSAIHLLRREFRETPPPELEHIKGWEQRYPQHLPNYLKRWQEDLKKMEKRMSIAQRAWRESIS